MEMHARTDAFRKDRARVYRCIALEKIGWLQHGFGTRDCPGWPPADWRLVSLRQVHSDRIIVVAETETGCAGEGDALITASAGRLLAVRTADCLPMLMAAPQRRVVAAAHAGWRGTAAGIAGKVVERLRAEFGVEAAELIVAIGPGIGPCCYQVGRDVADRFPGFAAGWHARPGVVKLDLAGVNRHQLEAAGVRPQNIYTGAPCTCCHPADFHSYRREPADGGRMVSAIGIRR